jgi:hypothetical protein
MQMDSHRQPSSAIGSNPSFAQAADQRRSTRDPGRARHHEGDRKVLDSLSLDERGLLEKCCATFRTSARTVGRVALRWRQIYRALSARQDNDTARRCLACGRVGRPGV